MIGYQPTHRPTAKIKQLAIRFSAEKLKKPPALHPGDTIAIVAPATPVCDEEMQDAVHYLRQKGYQVVQYAKTDQFGKHYLSDTDEGRANAINKAFANPLVKAIFSIQGGGGTFRPNFLKKLNWDLMRKHPKILTGYSDITFLHAALQAKAGIVSFHASFPSNKPQKKEDTKSFWSMVSPKSTKQAPTIIHAGPKYDCVVPGEAKGQLMGGNLSLLAATVGTPYQPDFQDKILILEDWKIDYETADCLFSQLVNHGLWDKIKGVVFGEFPQTPFTQGIYYGLTWENFIKDITKEAKKRGIPVGYNFPIGHGEKNHPIPLGVEAHFNSNTGTLTLLESPVVVEETPKAPNVSSGSGSP